MGGLSVKQIRKKLKNFKKPVDNWGKWVYNKANKRGNPEEDKMMEKAIWLGKRWQLGLWWRKDWKFFGLVENFGFGRYIGITFNRK